MKIKTENPKLWTFEDWHFLKYQGKTYILAEDIKRTQKEMAVILKGEK